MREPDHDRIASEIILGARLLLVLLYLIFGWSKLNNLPATVGYMAHSGLPLPWAATGLAILVEIGGSLALLLGVFTRPVALAMAVYTLATAFIGHPYWSMDGMARYEAEINFFKNVSIIGGFLLLYVTGAGRYALPVPRLRSRA